MSTSDDIKAQKKAELIEARRTSTVNKALEKATLKELARLKDLAAELTKRQKIEAAQNDFLEFVRYVWPEFIAGRHHSIMAEKFNRVAKGELKRLIINMPPRHTKSEFASFHLPAWLIGRNPRLKIMQTTHTATLAERFGRKTRNLMQDQPFQQIFPAATLRQDSQSAGKWETNKGGEYFAAGTGGAVTGRGADLLIIDDPHSEQDALSPTALEAAYEWYTSGPRQRLQPGGAIIIVMTRWAENDLTGKLLRHQQQNPLADQWEVVEFPAIMPSGNQLWPEFWPLEDLLKVKTSLPPSKWEAQWQQNPTSESVAILKRSWWKRWTKEKPPKVDYILIAFDTAYSKSETADYTAYTVWGVFFPVEGGPANLMMLDAKRGRWDFPDLRRKALEEYEFWNPDCMIVEAKASGMPLTQELRNMGIPVVTYSPGGRGHSNDKFVRINSVAPLLEAGLVWVPETLWAEEVVEECAAFPAGEHDDYVDTVSMALRRFREGGFLAHPEDYKEDEPPPRQRIYY